MRFLNFTSTYVCVHCFIFYVVKPILSRTEKNKNFMKKILQYIKKLVLRYWFDLNHFQSLYFYHPILKGFSTHRNFG
jgi:hypothetical protein